MPYMQAMRKFSRESWNEDARRLSKLSGYSNLLRAEREEPRRVPAICSFQPAHPASCTVGTGSLS